MRFIPQLWVIFWTVMRIIFNTCLPWNNHKWQLHLDSILYIPKSVWILAMLGWGKSGSITRSYLCYEEIQLIFPGTHNGPVAQPGLFWLQPHLFFFFIYASHLTCPMQFWDPGIWINPHSYKWQESVKERKHSKLSKDRGYSRCEHISNLSEDS